MIVTNSLMVNFLFTLEPNPAGARIKFTTQKKRKKDIRASENEPENPSYIFFSDFHDLPHRAFAYINFLFAINKIILLLL